MVSNFHSQKKIQKIAKDLGFDLCGMTQDFELTHKEYYLQWLKEQKNGQMQWLEKNQRIRVNPKELFPEVKSVIVVAMSYAHESSHSEYKIARYAHGKDYHIWIKEKLETFAHTIQEQIFSELKWKSFVDTGPVVERDLAVKSGLGWIGKNTCLLNEDLGSYLFLGEIFVNLDLEQAQIQEDQCLSCTLCIESCPTQALEPYQMNATQCLSYHNIEKRGERSKDFYKAMSDQIIGCDICQEVCPWNQRISETGQKPWLQSFSDYSSFTLKDFLKLTSTQYKKHFKSSAISRIKYIDFMRNIFLTIANTERKDLLDDVKKWKINHLDENIVELDYCLKQLEK